MSQSFSQATFISSRSAPASRWRRNQNTVKFGVSRQLGPVAHTVLVAVMLVVLGLVYLTQVNRTGAYSYELDKLRTQRDSLLSEQQDLEVQNARLQALERVQNSSVAKALTTPAKIDYAQN